MKQQMNVVSGENREGIVDTHGHARIKYVCSLHAESLSAPYDWQTQMIETENNGWAWNVMKIYTECKWLQCSAEYYLSALIREIRMVFNTVGKKPKVTVIIWDDRLSKRQNTCQYVHLKLKLVIGWV